MKHEETTGLIADFFAGEISDHDLERLEEWVNESPAHANIMRGQLRLLYGAMLSSAAATGASAATINKKRRRRRWLTAAASLSAAAMLAGVVFLLHKPESAQIEIDEIPQTTYATITTEHGASINLDDQSAVSVGGGAVSVGEGEQKQSYAARQMHLNVPRGGQYEITLVDGTHVWLNSDSELTFPSDFTETTRRVSLRGEAFFDVAKNPDKRFIVELSAGDIAVFGTRFCVSDYADRPLSAVLVEGSIRLSTNNGASVMMQPSQLAVIDRPTGAVELREIDTNQYTSWTRDRFVFYDQTLGEIAQTLERWYDVHITFANPELRTLPISGQLSRNADIRVLLDAYRGIAGINYSIEGKTITITRANNE